MPTLGFLSLGAAPTTGELDRTPISAGLKELGWMEGKNIRIERAYADKKVSVQPSHLEPTCFS